MLGGGHSTCELITLDSDEDEAQVIDERSKSSLPSKGPPSTSSTTSFQSEIPSRKRRRHTARKSTSSHAPRVKEVIDVTSDDEPSSSKEEDCPPVPHLRDGFEQFLNQVLLSLKPRVDAMRHIENDLTTAFRAMNIQPKHIEPLYSFLLQRTLNLSLDSEKVFLCVEEVKEEFLLHSSSPCPKVFEEVVEESPSHKRIKLMPAEPTETKKEFTKPKVECKTDKIPESKAVNNKACSKIISSNKSKVPLEVELEDEEVFVTKKKSKTLNGSKTIGAPSTSKPMSKKDIHLKKLKNALDECGKEIRRLELAEVNTNDEDSTYVRLCKYKVRFMTIYNKIIELEDGLPKWKSQVVSLQTLGSRQIKKFKTQISRHPEINEKIASFINKGIKKSLNSSFFPDFQDILSIYMEVNKSSNLGMHKEELYEEASDAFQIIGKKLQSRRKFDVHASMESYIEEDAPEPELSEDIMKKLTANQALAEKSLDKVIQDFTLRQVTSIKNPEIPCDSSSSSVKEPEVKDDAEESGESSGEEVESEGSDEEDLPSSDDDDDSKEED